LALVSVSARVYNLHPNLHEDGSLDGQGECSRFPTDQWYEE